MKSSKSFRAFGLTLLLTCAASMPAMAQINVTIGIAPPPVQFEAVPVLQPGYVFAPGYWGWSGSKYVWVRGRTIAQRDGYRWVPDRWDQRNGSYFRQVGRWENDPSWRPQVKKAKSPKHDGIHDQGRGNHSYDANRGKGHDNGKGKGNDNGRGNGRGN